jgi:hypothetical protein
MQFNILVDEVDDDGPGVTSKGDDDLSAAGDLPNRS